MVDEDREFEEWFLGLRSDEREHVLLVMDAECEHAALARVGEGYAFCWCDGCREVVAHTLVAAMWCCDCSRDTLRGHEYYMVTADVWTAAGMHADGMDPASDGEFLCIACLEMRLGRVLTPEDFMDAPINDLAAPWANRSPRLLSRLTGQPEPRGG